MRLWFDEDLSPTLVQVAQRCGFEATCNRDRGVLGIKDPALRRIVQAEGFVLVTDNAADFRPMYARQARHPGLAVMPAGVGRVRQQQLAAALIEWIAEAAAVAGQPPGEYMADRLAEIDATGACSAQALQ